MPEERGAIESLNLWPPGCKDYPKGDYSQSCELPITNHVV
jgi:hypothetical protein